MMEERINELKIADGEGIFLSGYANLFYYTGFASEDGYALITKDQRLLITDSRYLVQAKEQAKGFEVADIARGLDKLFSAFPLEQMGFEEECMTVSVLSRLKKKVPGIELVPMQARINKPRRRKSPEEIEKIRAAEALGDAAFSHILNRIKPGMREKDIALELEWYMKKNGASKLSFDTIAASGVRGAMPHGIASNKVIKRGELLTLDFGCVLDGYCSDMTRTVAIGHVDGRLREIYDTVLAAQQMALISAAEGMPCAEIDKIARDIINNAGCGAYFGHSLGHSVGIEIHESPNFSPKSPDRFEIGNVITVEPGIYIEGLGGVRIEDVLAMTPEGAVNLTKSPKEWIEIS